MVSRKQIKRLAVTTILVLTFLAALATAAYAADSANIAITVDGDIPAYIEKFAITIKEPLQVALNYLTSFLAYLSNWLGQF